MKKSWFIAILILLILLVGVFGWILFAPERSGSTGTIGSGVRSLFGILDDIDTPQTTTPIATSTTPISNEDFEEDYDENEEFDRVPTFVARQIGNYPVASVQPLEFRFGTTSTTTLFVSVGKENGQLRSFNVNTQETNLIGTLNIPNIILAQFTANSRYLVIQSYTNNRLRTIILQMTLPRSESEERLFTPVYSSSDIRSFFIDQNTIYVIEKVRSGSNVYRFNQAQNNLDLIHKGFIGELYGFASFGDVYLGTKASAGDTGFVFKLNPQEEVVETLTFGESITFIPTQNRNEYITFTLNRSGITTLVQNTATNTRQILRINTWKDKCTPDFSSSAFIFCGGITSGYTGTILQDWYMGERTTNDTLFLMSTRSGEISELAFPGEPVDVIDPHSSRFSGMFSFINKKDFTPWAIYVE